MADSEADTYELFVAAKVLTVNVCVELGANKDAGTAILAGGLAATSPSSPST